MIRSIVDEHLLEMTGIDCVILFLAEVKGQLSDEAFLLLFLDFHIVDLLFLNVFDQLLIFGTVGVASNRTLLAGLGGQNWLCSGRCPYFVLIQSMQKSSPRKGSTRFAWENAKKP